jgi:thiosulfate reductase cytochrome b subunit
MSMLFLPPPLSHGGMSCAQRVPTSIAETAGVGALWTGLLQASGWQVHCARRLLQLRLPAVQCTTNHFTSAVAVGLSLHALCIWGK